MNDKELITYINEAMARADAAANNAERAGILEALAIVVRTTLIRRNQ